MLSHFSHCLILCDPMGCSPPGSSFHGILQARMLEWVAMPSSRGSSRPRARTRVSYVSCVGRRVLYHQCHQWSQKFPNCWRDWLATPDVSQDQVPGRGTWSMSGRNDDSEMAEWDLSRCVSKKKSLVSLSSKPRRTWSSEFVCRRNEPCDHFSGTWTKHPIYERESRKKPLLNSLMNARKKRAEYTACLRLLMKHKTRPLCPVSKKRAMLFLATDLGYLFLLLFFTFF